MNQRTAAVIASIAMAFTLVACGNSPDEVVPSATRAGAETSAERDAFIADLRAEGAAAGASQEEIDCVIDAIASLDADELQSIEDGTPSVQTQDIIVAATEKCAPLPSPAGS